MAQSTMWLIFTLSLSVAMSARVKVQPTQTQLATTAEETGSLEHVNQFLEAATALGPQGEAAGTLAKMLESGVEGSIRSSSFANTDGALTLEVEHSKVNQGEIATPSKVPVMWTLDVTTRYTFQSHVGGRWRLYVSGIKMLPFAEGREMYEASGVAGACASTVALVAKVQCERKALLKWYANQWSTFKKSNYVDYRKHPAHKLGRILKGMYGGTMTYRAIKFGGKGDEAWEKIVYALSTIPPTEIEHFEFLTNSKKMKEVEIAMVTHPALEGTYGDQDLSVYAGLDFQAKNGAEFDPDAFEDQRSSGERFARSGLNFGAMVAKGQSEEILNMEKVRGGTAEYILNFASPCTKKTKTDGNNDPTEGCRDSYGRVFWY